MLARTFVLLLAVPCAAAGAGNNTDDKLRKDHLKCYALRYPDLLHGYCKDDSEACDFDGLEKHFKAYGITERRILSCIAEDVKCYAKRYPDLASGFCGGHFRGCTHESYIELLKHFSVAGLKEGREFGCRAEPTEVFLQGVKETARKVPGAQQCSQNTSVARNLSLILSEAIEVQNHGIFHDHTQVQFIVQRLCESRRPKQICEVGFRTGHSALLLLEAVPSAKITSFASGEPSKPAATAAQLLRQAYGERFEAVFGAPAYTIPEFQRLHPEQRCDVILMDDARDYGERLVDIMNIRSASDPAALLILRQICSKECARSGVATWGASKQPCASCHGGGPLAYSKAHQLALLHVANCSVPSTSTKAGNSSTGAADVAPDGTCTALWQDGSHMLDTAPSAASIAHNASRHP